MKRVFEDRENRPDSPLHRLDARTKIVFTLFFVVLLVTTPPRHLLTFVFFAGLLLWLIALSRLPLRPLVARAALVLPFSALTALGLPLIHGGETVQLWGFSLSITGLWIFFGVAVKSFLGATALVFLAATTPASDLLKGLRRLGAPKLFTDMLALTYRYLFLLVEEGTRLRRAAAARGYAPRWLPQAMIVGRLIGTLFLRSYERAERVYGAMRLRGYHDGRLPDSVPAPLSWREVAGNGLAITVLVIVRLLTP